MIRLGIIGTGIMAPLHTNAFKTIRGVKPAACCDIIARKAGKFAKTYDIDAVYTDWRKMLNEAQLDAVSIITPDIAHAQISIAAAKKGLHVLCEKPLAKNVPEARRMVHAVKKYGVINMVNFSHRYPALLKAKQLIEQGDIGKIVYVEAAYMQSWLISRCWGDWRKEKPWLLKLTTQTGNNGVLYDLGCHITDFATLAAGEISKVFCQIKTFDKGIKGRTYKGYKLDANDTVTINAVFKNGAVGLIRTTRWAGGHINDISLNINGTKGAIEIDTSLATDKLRLCTGVDLHKPKWKTISCGKHKDNYHRFIKSIKTGINDTPDFERGLEIQRYLQKCELSDRLKKQVNV